MGTTVSFNGFVHAQRKADGIDDVASIDFWVTDTDPGNAATAIPLPIFTSQPTPDASVNLARNTALLTEAAIEGDTVVVSSKNVASPVAVRYAYRMNPAGANLYNKEGLPASPFRSDEW